jgi:hypothetical protein
MNGHEVALWAGVAAFFGSLATIGAIEVINPDQIIKLAGSLVVALITAGGVYAKQRLDDAKAARGDRPDGGE